MTTTLQCAYKYCTKPVTYDKPLCYPHWKLFDRHEIVECVKCHRFDLEENIDPPIDADHLGMCDDCFRGQEVPVHGHKPVEYQTRYLYILKLDGGEYYAGQTNDLEIRLKEHEDGLTKTTAGKHPKLVWFDKWEGDREELNAEEEHLTKLTNEVGWEKWTPKSDKLERRRCQDEEGPARKVYQGIPAGSSEAGIGRKSVIARGRASVVLTAIDVRVLGEAI